jgi:hypothetical protein
MFEDFCNLEDGCELNREEMRVFFFPQESVDYLVCFLSAVCCQVSVLI